MKNPAPIVLLAAMSLIGCMRPEAVGGAHPLHAGREARIVSLMPSLTEDLIAIGAGPQLVAVDQYSEDVLGPRKLPVVANFSSINAERIVALHPDLIVGIPAQERLLQPLLRAGIQRALFSDDSFADIFADIGGLGRLTNREVASERLQQRLRARTQELRRLIRYHRVPSVFVVLDTNPIYTVGRRSYMSTLIGMAGGRNAAQALQVAYASFGAEALLRLQPDVLVTDKTTGLQAVLQTEPWKSLRAVAQHHVFVVDPAAILERPGPRYNEGLSWLIAHLQTPAK
ncbi:MAG: cobalamin-binding protein [Vulcanimicrobiaceae bacterium]